MTTKPATKKPTDSTGRATALPRWAYVLLTFSSFAAALFFTFRLVFENTQVQPENYFFLFAIFGLAVAVLFFGLTEIIADVNGHVLGFAIKAGGPFASFLIVLLFGLFSRTLLPSQTKLNIQLHGPGGLADLPLKNASNALAMMPTNGAQGIIMHIDGNGIAHCTPTDDFYLDSVYFQLTDKRYITADKRYKLSKGKDFLPIVISAPKTNYRFTFVDADDPNERLSGVLFLCSELHVNATTDASGVIDVLADSTGFQLYNFSIKSSDHINKHSVSLDRTVTHPVFHLDKKN